jgi:hypothetical protein
VRRQVYCHVGLRQNEEHRCAVNTTTATLSFAATRSDAQNPNHIYQWCHHNKRDTTEEYRRAVNLTTATLAFAVAATVPKSQKPANRDETMADVTPC